MSTMKHQIFRDKNCFITGATGGIGQHIARKMAEEKCNLFLTATNIEKIDRLKRELESIHPGEITVCGEAGDLNSISDIENLISSSRNRFNAIDIFIHCAGAFIVKPLSESDMQDFEASFNLNVRAVFLFVKAFSPDMIRNRWGRIITIGSSSAYAGVKNTSFYCASKHALLGLTRSIHDELKVHNIRAFCVSPAGTKTEMGRRIENQDYDTFLNPAEIAEYVAFIGSFDGEMVSDEIRLNRMIIR